MWLNVALIQSIKSEQFLVEHDWMESKYKFAASDNTSLAASIQKQNMSNLAIGIRQLHRV